LTFGANQTRANRYIEMDYYAIFHLHARLWMKYAYLSYRFIIIVL
jgi:hypothetical protein